jgi:hypothetical protein
MSRPFVTFRFFLADSEQMAEQTLSKSEVRYITPLSL